MFLHVPVTTLIRVRLTMVFVDADHADADEDDGYADTLTRSVVGPAHGVVRRIHELIATRGNGAHYQLVSMERASSRRSGRRSRRGMLMFVMRVRVRRTARATR